MDLEFLLESIVIVIVLIVIINNTRAMFAGQVGRPLPGPRPLILVGNTFDVDRHNIHHSFEIIAKMYGALVKLSIFRQDVILVNDGTLLKEMFADSAHGDVFNDRPTNTYSKHITYDNKSLVFGPANSRTSAMRKIYLNALNLSGDGNERFEIIKEDALKQFISDISDTNNKDFDANLFIRKSLGNSTASLLTGKPADEEDWKLIFEFIDGVNLLASVENAFVYDVFPFVRFIPCRFRDYFRSTITTRDNLMERFYYKILDNFDRESDEIYGFTEALVKLSKDHKSKQDCDFISEDHVKSMVLDTIFGATETSASALHNAFGILVKYNDVAKKLQVEIDSVIGTGRLPRLSDKNNMPYLMATIWEVLRYTSHVPVLVPHRVLKTYNYRGYFMPKNALVIANIWYIHHDPKVWHDPWEFTPERFLDSEGNLLPPNHKLMQNVLSFSIGGRKCLGEAMGISKLFLYIGGVLQSFDLLPASSGELPDTDPRNYKRGVGVITVKDFMCRVLPRK